MEVTLVFLSSIGDPPEALVGNFHCEVRTWNRFTIFAISVSRLGKAVAGELDPARAARGCDSFARRRYDNLQ